MYSNSILALAAFLSVGQAAYQGFNFASTKPGGGIMQLQDWKDAFQGQSSLADTNGAFTSARLYTMIKDENAANPEPILAFQAASDDGKTSLLLGIWASAGQAGVDKEIAALQAAEKQFPNLASQIVGISVGSEDLYRVSNIANKTNAANPDKPLGPGVFPSTMLSYVNQVKANLTGAWAKVPVGHVDTWTAYTNDDGSFNQNELSAFIKALDFLGVDTYPYFQGTMSNRIDQASDLFIQAYQKVAGVANGAAVWITETGWPSFGDTINLAEASQSNAQTYWQKVGCPNFGKINVWWYTYDDSASKPEFGVVKSLTGGATTWNLSCTGYTNGPDAAHATPVGSNSTSSNSTSGSSSTSSSSSSPGSSSTSSGGGASSTSGSAKPSGTKASAATMATISSLLALTGLFMAFAVAL